jgi:hypothetical protein
MIPFDVGWTTNRAGTETPGCDSRSVDGRVAIAACRSDDGVGLYPDPDWPLLQRSLLVQGIKGVAVSWDDPDAAWDAFDLVVVRSTWDSVDRPEEFLTWVHAVANVTPIENGPEVLAWNLDKTYLIDLERAGLPVVPTTWVRPGVAWTPPAVPFVVKPTISAGGRETARYDTRVEEARAHVARLHAVGQTVMLQPYLSSVDTRAETKMTFLDGHFSHAISFGPLLEADAGVMDSPWEKDVALSLRNPTPAELDLANAVIAYTTDRFGSLLSSRVDTATTDDGVPVLLELELVEPMLALWAEPQAPSTLATAIASRLKPTRNE